MDHVRLHPMRPKPPRQPEAVAAGFEGKRNPRDLFTGSDCLIAPAMQQAKQPFGTRLQFLARLTLNAGKHTANQPTRLAHLDDGNDRAILVQGDEGPAQVVRLGHQGTLDAATMVPSPRRLPHTISPVEGVEPSVLTQNALDPASTTVQSVPLSMPSDAQKASPLGKARYLRGLSRVGGQEIGNSLSATPIGRLRPLEQE